MIIGRCRFNVYLLIACAALLACGCRSTKTKEEKQKEKQVSTLRLHMEVTASTDAFSVAVPIFREKPVMINVDKDPFLTEVNVEEANVVDVMGGFELQIKFDHEGAMLLENYTTANPGRHIAVFSLFGKTKEESRWLAAPAISKRISNGVLTFTPDATREEAEKIALGLNNVHKKILKQNKW
jgi:preprotein translocase subunit SecD